MKKYNIEINEEEWGVIKKERLDLDKIREAMKILDNLHKRMEKVHTVMEAAKLSPRSYTTFIDTRIRIMKSIIGSRFDCFNEGDTFIIQPVELGWGEGNVENEETKALKTKLEKEGWKTSKTASCRTGIRFRIPILDEIFDSPRFQVIVAAIRFDELRHC